MPQFTALIVTRRKDGTPGTYTLTHEIEDRRSMYIYVLDKYTNKYEEVESITILEEIND